MKLQSFILVFLATLAFAGKPSPDVAVTTYLSDTTATSTPYYIQSDGQPGPLHSVPGEYDNAYQNVTSVLNANTYNNKPPGDWTLDLLTSTRTIRLTLNSLNEIQPGQPGYTVPPNPPFVGTGSVVSRFAEYCTAIGLDMGTMTAAYQTIQCPAILRFDWNSSLYYRVYMTGSWSAPGQYAPETTYVQIQCNSVGISGYCNDWYIDPIPVSNGDGSFSPGVAIGRLVALTTKGTGTPTNEGDFYLTFHVHVTRP